MKPRPVDAAYVKERAKDWGADLVGIASAAALNRFAPDPLWPQTPERVSPYCKSVIVIAQRIPVACFRCLTNLPVQYNDMLVLRRLDRIGQRLADHLESRGHPTFVTAAQETDWSLKKGSYGRLSTRHLAVEAGLGTLGLEVNLLTPEFGPRVYVTGILTELELEADGPMTEQVCIGESCSRCLHSCPVDAVLHFDIDKRSCAKAAQEFGYAQITGFFQDFIGAPRERKRALVRSRDVFGFWQGLLRVVGSFGDCPRCLAVCPVGNDYHAHLTEAQRLIPEKTPEKVAKAASYKDARRRGDEVPGLNSWNVRWVGPQGYKGLVGRQIQEFRREQAERQGGKEASVAGFEKQPLTAAAIKAKARELGADLVGIADGKAMDRHPPDPRDPRRPSDITRHDGDRVIVIAKRLNSGTTRLLPWNERHKYYNDELTLSLLEGIALELVLWLENRGYPALAIPPAHVDAWRYKGDPAQHLKPILSLTHAAVEAGLGTLGLNLQLLTPEFGPRVMLSAVLSSVDVEPDQRLETALCLGPSCGRCLKTCPGDTVRHWDRDWAACDRFRSPHGFAALADFLGGVIEEPDPEKQKAMLRSEPGFYIWQSILRGAGVVTGCRRCEDVCPVGEDYERMLKDALEEIPEHTPDKQTRLEGMARSEEAEGPPAAYREQSRWIGKLGYLADKGDRP